MAALILQFLPYLFQAATTIPQIWEYIQKVKADLQQKGQWTPEVEEAFNLELKNLEANPPPWWNPEEAA